MFNVIEDEVGVLQYSLEIFPGTIAAGLYRRMDLFSFASFQEISNKLRLPSGLPSANGHAPSGVLEKNDIFFNLLKNFLDTHESSEKLSRIRKTAFDAFPAVFTQLPVDDELTPVHPHGSFRAQINARSTTDTFRWEISDLLKEALALRIAAPETSKSAALHEDQEPDARAVVDGVPIDVKD
jgi:hypothetical protein